MSVAGLAGFLQGFGTARQTIRDRKLQEADAARQDRYIAALENGALRGAGAGETFGLGPQQRGGYGTPGQSAAPPGTGLLGLIDKHEGGGAYDTLLGFSNNGGAFNGVDVSKMTLAELYQFSDPNGPYGQWSKDQLGYVATPMGRHQIVGTTLRTAAEGMGLSPETRFNANTQDAMAAYLARNRLAGAKTPAAKRAALRAEWEGFKHVADDVLDAAIVDFEANGGILVPRPMGLGPRPQ